MAYISKVNLGGADNYDLIDQTIGFSSSVENENLTMKLVRDGAGLPDATTIAEDIQELNDTKQDNLVPDAANETLVF